MHFTRAFTFLLIFGGFSFCAHADGGMFSVTIDGTRRHFTTMAAAESAIRNGPAPRPQLVQVDMTLDNNTGQIKYFYDVPQNDLPPIPDDLSYFPSGTGANPICDGPNGTWCFSEGGFLAVRIGWSHRAAIAWFPRRWRTEPGHLTHGRTVFQAPRAGTHSGFATSDAAFQSVIAKSRRGLPNASRG